MTSLASLTPNSGRPRPADQADLYRFEMSRRLDPKKRSRMGQFFTPLPIATFMASMFRKVVPDVSLLDPGAGAGILSAAFVQDMAERSAKPVSIRLESFELDPFVGSYLEKTLADSAIAAQSAGMAYSATNRQQDFIKWGLEQLSDQGALWDSEPPRFTHCIMNPPYKKIRSDHEHRKLIRKIGIETGNLYSAFMALAIKLLAPSGEMVAVVPRSFCNGPYFRSFRKLLLESMAIRDLHVFDSRTLTFKDDEVLQENIIIHAVKGEEQGAVTITSSNGPDFADLTWRKTAFSNVVKPDDSDQFIHIATSDLDQMVIDRISVFSSPLSEISMDVSTGPVVDFRLRDDLRQEADNGAYPLIYSNNFSSNYIKWPKTNGNKPNAIGESDRSAPYLMPNGWYVVVRRFSSKEERRRIVAALHVPERVPGKKIGFENHLNVYHQRKTGLDSVLAKGLAVFLNSTLLDLYFRQFSGHTQVNATDLRMLQYPDIDTLRDLGRLVAEDFPTQTEVDRAIDAEINKMTGEQNGGPLAIRQRIGDAQKILKALDLPKGQLNERSALTLLALVDLKPDDDWSEAGNPLIGITPIMDFISEHYAKKYAPNTRETIRRQTMHQYMEAGIAISNPDKPDRAVNSPKWNYQVTPKVLDLLHAYGTDAWKGKLSDYLEDAATLSEQYARERDMHMIPLKIGGGKELKLTPGKHSELIRDIIYEFGPRYAPEADVLYVGDTGAKMGHFDEGAFESLGLTFDSHGKFPDVVLYLRSKNWLLLVESVTSHGPVDAKRHSELSELMADSEADIIYVTAFPDRQAMSKYIVDISWETEVWVAEAPTHLIHFDGERFLGPY